MNWREEANCLNFDKNNVYKNYVKDELKKYYYYVSEYLEHKNNLHLLTIKYAAYLNDPVNTTSFIKVSDKNNESQNRVIFWESEIQEEKDKVKNLEERLDMLDSWLSILTFQQKEIVKNYVCKRGCTNSQEAADELNYSRLHMLHIVKTSIDKIYFNFFSKKRA